MSDEFQKQFPWIGGLLDRSPSHRCDVGSTQNAALLRLKHGWGRRDTAELLKELEAQYGEAAGRAVDQFLEANIRRDWTEIGKKQAHEGTEIDDFIRVLWDPLVAQGFEFSIRRDGGAATFCVSKCPVYELAKRTGMHEWLYRLACATDYYTTPAFSPKIRFTRTKTLMQGDACCDHNYRCW